MSVLAGAEPYAGDAGQVGALLVHGFTGSPQSLRGWAEGLYDAGVTVRLPRLPGHGTRWQDLNRTRWEDWYGEVERGFDELCARCTDVFVMGLSMGGTLSLRLAEVRPDELAGLVLVNPSVLSTRRDVRFLLPSLRFVKRSFPAVAGDIKKPGVTELAYPRTPLRAAYSLTRLWRLVRAELPQVRCPLLLLSSTEDHVVEPQNWRTVLNSVGSPAPEHVELVDSYHVATLDNDAQVVVEQSLRFVRDHTRSMSGRAGDPADRRDGR